MHSLPQQLTVGFQLRPHFDSTTHPPVSTSDKEWARPRTAGHNGGITVSLNATAEMVQVGDRSANYAS